MIKTIWFLMIALGIIYGALTGNLNEINNIIVREASEGATFALGLLGIMSFWIGMMNIAEKSGLIESISKVFRPIMKILFPDIPKGHVAERWILMNFIANMLGLGNGATAFGLKAMKELDTLNPNKKQASNSMAMFLIINMSALQLVSMTIIKIRYDYGASNPSGIVGITILATLLSTVVAIIIGKILEGEEKC